MKSLIFFIISLLFVKNILAQTAVTTTTKTATERVNNLNQALANSDNIVFQTTDGRYAGLVGTPYFIPNWSKSQLTKTNGAQLEDVPLKYNVATQSLLLLRPSMNDSLMLLPEQIDRFVLFDTGGQPWPFRRYPAARAIDPAVTQGFFLVLFEGKTSLLKRVSKTLQKANFRGAYSPDDRQDTYVDEPSYYLLRPDQTLVKIKKSLKSLLEAVAPRQAEVKAFAEQEKIGGKTDLELARLVQFFDELK